MEGGWRVDGWVNVRSDGGRMLGRMESGWVGKC